MGILTQEEATAVRTAIASLNKTYPTIAYELGGFSDKTLRVMLGTEDTTPKSVGIGIINNTKKCFQNVLLNRIRRKPLIHQQHPKKLLQQRQHKNQ